MIRNITLITLAGLSCGFMHGADWVGRQIDAVTLATGLRQPTPGEQFQQAAHQVGQGVSSFLNDLTTPSSAPSSSNSAVSSSPRVPSARALQRQQLYAQEREEARYGSSSSTNKYPENWPLPAGYVPIQSFAAAETRREMLTRMLNENKEAAIVVGGISTAALLGFAFYALKK
jgi:hypothetical protein